jgi:hypothetical protein
MRTTSDKCAHCDVCARPAEDVERRDVTYPSWLLLKTAQMLGKKRSNTTIVQLANIARGCFELKGRGMHQGDLVDGVISDSLVVSPECLM